MKCPQCRGTIARESARCPHCGVLRSGLALNRQRPARSSRPNRSPVGTPIDPTQRATELFTTARSFAMRDNKTKIATAVVTGVIVAAILPGVPWFAGGLIGGLAAHKLLERKR